MPRHFMCSDKQIIPEVFFSEVHYSGAHDKTAYLVRDGTIDLGVANSEIIKKMIRDGRLKENDVRVLWETLESRQSLINFALLGVSIAMDDFGIGYSSLSYLRSYPFDVLKIDRSFIRNIAANSADRELINAAISLAHSLHLKVVAEGVETEEQLAYLKKLSCDYAQGFFFSEPVPAEQLTGMLSTS